MKILKNALILCLLFTATSLSAQKMGKLTFDYVTINIVEGYDHDSRLVVYIDGEKIATSDVHKESDHKKLTVSVTRGKHKVRAVLETLYDGVWEEHIKENEYSVDSEYDSELTIKKKMTIIMKMDIDKEATSIQIK